MKKIAMFGICGKMGTSMTKELLKEKIKKGLSLSSSYSWKKMTSETLEIYRELLKT